MLTRTEMEKAIAEGGSVLVKGAIIARVEDLPTAAEIAQGDPAKEAAARQDLEAKVADLQSQLALLQGGAGQSGTQAQPDLALDDAALAQKLRAAGFDTAEKIVAASDEELLKVPGVGQATVNKLRAAQQG
jgi:DNA uptake protein ComE-like DNA-binding protein